MVWSLTWCIPVWYVIAAAVLILAAFVGLIVGEFLAGRFSPSGSLRPSPGLPHPEGENTWACHGKRQHCVTGATTT